MLAPLPQRGDTLTPYRKVPCRDRGPWMFCNWVLLKQITSFLRRIKTPLLLIQRFRFVLQTTRVLTLYKTMQISAIRDVRNVINLAIRSINENYIKKKVLTKYTIKKYIRLYIEHVLAGHHHQDSQKYVWIYYKPYS